MKRRTRIAALIGAATIFTTLGVGVSVAGAGGGGEVVIVAWPGYIEDGSTDPAFDWVTGFEKKTGCEVKVKTAGTSDEMVSLMTGSPGEYDLVTASGDASNRLIAGKTVQPIDIKKIKGYETVDRRLQNAPWHTVKGKHYGVPYQWGTNVLMYNTDVFTTPPDSWSVVFEEQTLPDGSSNVGRVEAYDGAIYIADAAVYLRATQPDLGIDDPYQLTREQFDAAVDLLRQQRDLVGRYWHDYAIQIEDFTNEDYVASSTWPIQVNLLVGDDQPIASVVPKEGVTGWADTTMLATDAPNEACAYKWLNHSITLGIQGDLAAWFGSVPAVPAACEGNELLTDEGCATNGSENFDKVEFWKTPVADCGKSEECVPYHEWVTAYVAVIGGR